MVGGKPAKPLIPRGPRWWCHPAAHAALELSMLIGERARIEKIAEEDWCATAMGPSKDDQFLGR